MASPGDEQLVSRFSGRVDDRVGRFVGRPQVDRWVWDQKLVAILGYPRPDELVPLQTVQRAAGCVSVTDRLMTEAGQLPTQASVLIDSAVQPGGEGRWLGQTP